MWSSCRVATTIQKACRKLSTRDSFRDRLWRSPTIRCSLDAEHGQNGVVFRAGDPQSFYQAIHDLVHNAMLYERLSLEGDEFATRMYGPLKWHQVVTRWISESAEDDTWLRQFSVTG